MSVLRKLVCGDNRDPPPLPGLDKPAPPRSEGDLPTPFILLDEDFEGEFRKVGVVGVLGFAPSGGGLLLRPDMVVLCIIRTVAEADCDCQISESRVRGAANCSQPRTGRIWRGRSKWVIGSGQYFWPIYWYSGASTPVSQEDQR